MKEKIRLLNHYAIVKDSQVRLKKISHQDVAKMSQAIQTYGIIWNYSKISRNFKLQIIRINMLIAVLLYRCAKVARVLGNKWREAKALAVIRVIWHTNVCNL